MQINQLSSEDKELGGAENRWKRQSLLEKALSLSTVQRKTGWAQGWSGSGS